MKAKVLLAISGGIDSAMSAMILKNEGYCVTAVYAKTHAFDEIHKENLAKIKQICDYLKIDFFELDLQENFKNQVIKPFVSDYLNAKTPNPCALCNQKIKFGEFALIASKMGFDFLATGHYAKTDGTFIYEAFDKTKDQSYFLYAINKDVLPNVLFPLENEVKTKLKAMAAKIPEFANLSAQKESSEICFVQNSYLEVLKDFGANIEQSGEVIDSSGKVIGKHKGYLQYTIGQRKGFDAPLLQTPHYVTNVDPLSNRITVAEREFLGGDSFAIMDGNWFEKSTKAFAKIRYQAPKIECEIDGNFVKLKENAFAITKGQSAVFYDGEKLLGGGVIA